VVNATKENICLDVVNKQLMTIRQIPEFALVPDMWEDFIAKAFEYAMSRPERRVIL